MEIRKCGPDDVNTLSAMNKQLIEDEGHDNPMNKDELAKRMESFLAGEYEAVFFTEDEEILGYALIKKTSTPFYIRQFFICRKHRRKGFGRIFFGDLLRYLGTDTADIEVLAWNKPGICFWESLGFQPRSMYMRYMESSADETTDKYDV